MNEEQEKELRFLAAVKRELNRGAQTLDPQTVARLRAARHKAIEARPAGRAWLVTGGLATATMSVALIAFLWFTPIATPPSANIEQLDLLSENDSLELYDDLEFYRWLAARTDAT